MGGDQGRGRRILWGEYSVRGIQLQGLPGEGVECPSNSNRRDPPPFHQPQGGQVAPTPLQAAEARRSCREGGILGAWWDKGCLSG